MRGRLAAGVLCLAALSGCAGRELTDVTLIQALGVDGAGPVELTAVGEDEGERTVYRVRGENVTLAQEGLKDLGETRLEVTHVAQLVLGRSADLTDTLWREVIHRKSGYGATVWLADGEAGALLEGSADLSRRLKAMEENAGVRAPTLMEALSTLTREGQVELPVLTAADGAPELAGYRTVKGR